MKRMTLLIIVLVAGLNLTGCMMGPYGQSIDKHDFYSTVQMPVTLELWDRMTNEIIWQLDVPVNKKAVVQLEHATTTTMSQTPATNPTSIKWSIYEPGSLSIRLKNQMELDGNPVLLKYVIRDTPEAVATGMPIIVSEPVVDAAPAVADIPAVKSPATDIPVARSPATTPAPKAVLTVPAVKPITTIRKPVTTESSQASTAQPVTTSKASQSKSIQKDKKITSKAPKKKMKLRTRKLYHRR